MRYHHPLIHPSTHFNPCIIISLKTSGFTSPSPRAPLVYEHPVAHLFNLNRPSTISLHDSTTTRTFLLACAAGTCPTASDETNKRRPLNPKMPRCSIPDSRSRLFLKGVHVLSFHNNRRPGVKERESGGGGRDWR